MFFVQLPPSNVAKLPIIRSTQNCNYSLRYCAATSLQRGQAWARWTEVAEQKTWPGTEAVVTVLCTPDDGCGWHPKHVEWTCRIINRLLCVASRWTIIDMLTKKHFVCDQELLSKINFTLFFLIRVMSFDLSEILFALKTWRTTVYELQVRCVFGRLLSPSTFLLIFRC